MIEDYIVSKIVDLSIKKLRDLLFSRNRKLSKQPVDIQNIIAHHLKILENWSSQISFKDLSQPKNILDTYIELDLIFTPRRLKIENSNIETKNFNQVFSNEASHIVVLGLPGAGKTTTMKRLCQELLHLETTKFSNYNFPIVIRLREMSNYLNISNPLISKLYNEFVPKIELVKKEEKQAVDYLIEISTLNFIESLKIVLVLDGFDEIQDQTLKKDVAEDIRKLALGFSESRIILTSRTSDYNLKIDNMSEYELNSLSDEQIYSFALMWLKNDKSANNLVNLLENSPFYDTTIRPLTLAHLCAIFERDGRIPERPKSVYKKIINLLLEEWNAQKGVIKNSRFSNFEIDRKFEFLSHLAYFLTVEFGKTTFSKNELAKCYELICHNFNLPISELTIVVDELESHNGLFIQSGYDSYEFAHKSLQEYLTAEYIVRLPSVPTERNILFSLPNELAIAVALSSDSTSYFKNIFLDRLIYTLDSLEFIRIFISRISIELPNFRTDKNLAMTVLYLYTLYTDKFANISKEEYLDFLNSFKKLLQIEPIYKSIKKLIIKGNIENRYEINLNEYQFDNDFFDEQNNIRFIKKKKENGDEFVNSAFIPDYVYFNPKILVR